jgi:DNA-binding HxlR family transcriptional regulator
VAPGDSAECRIVREFLSQLGDKWTLLVILALSSAPMRFNAVQRAVVGISHRMLTVTLRKLERDGLVHRVLFPGVAPHAEYALTPLGNSFIDPVMAVANWAIGAHPQIEANRARFDR